MLFSLQGAVLCFAALGDVKMGGVGGAVPFCKARRKPCCCGIVQKALQRGCKAYSLSFLSLSFPCRPIDWGCL